MSIITSILPLLLGTVFMMLGNGILGTLLSIRTLQNGASEIETGLLVSSYFFGLIVSALTVHRIVARVGHIRAFATFATIFSASILAHGLLTSIDYWFILRVIEGICMGAFFMIIESWLNARAENNSRGTILSTYMCTVYLSQGGGQFILNSTDPQSFEILAIVSILISLALIPVALTKLQEPPKPSQSLLSIKKLIAVSPLGVVGVFLGGLMMGGLYGLGPVYADKMSLGVSGTATFMAALIWGGLFLQFPIGSLSDRFDRRIVITCLLIVASITSFSFGMLTLSYWPMMITVSLVGGFVFILYSLSICHTNDFLSSDEMVGASGGLLLVYSVAAVIGPMVCGYAMDLLGEKGFPFYFAAISLSGALFSIYRMIVGAKLNKAKKNAYQAIPRTSTMVSEFTPRREDETVED